MDTFPFSKVTKPFGGRDAPLGIGGEVALIESLSLDLQMEEMQGSKAGESFVCLSFIPIRRLADGWSADKGDKQARTTVELFVLRYDLRADISATCRVSAGHATIQLISCLLLVAPSGASCWPGSASGSSASVRPMRVASWTGGL